MPRMKCFNPCKRKPHGFVDPKNLRLISKEISNQFGVEQGKFICGTCRLQMNTECETSVSKNIMERTESNADSYIQNMVVDQPISNLFNINNDASEEM